MTIRTIAAVAAGAVAFGLAGATPALSQASFKGKTITVIVPSGSGGTFHVYAQLVQRHFARHIPGAPKMIIQNRPGGGGGVAASYMMNAAPKDGTIVAEMAPGTITVPMMRKVKFDATKFEFLGSIAARTYTFAVWHTAPVNTIQDTMKTVVTFGNTGKTSTGFQFPTFANTVLGTKFKIISGYKGGGAINLAMERGEVQGRGNFYSGWTGARPSWIPENKIKILLKLGPDRPEVANVPHIRDLLKTPEDRQMYDLLDVNLNVGQAFYVPPGSPKAIVDTLRTSFEALVKDPALKAEADKRQVPISPVSATEIDQWVKKAIAVPKSSVDRVAKILGFKK